MKRYETIVVGAGPAGLSAAIEAAKAGMEVAVFDENDRPGGQLFKQIHKFFGSKEHKAKIRGFHIGEELLDEAKKFGVHVQLNSVVLGIFECNGISVMHKDQVEHYKADNIIVATGAAENMIAFDGWTLPGVIGAGAAQTMMNLHHVMPGKKILMIGSGNVGLVVSYQLLQAGCEVAGIIDVAPRISGYGVHAAKLARCGVPFMLAHTVVKAEGAEYVTGVTIVQVNEKFKPIAGTEKKFDVDTICLAVGLSPMSQIAKMIGCKMVNNGGTVPECNEYGETSLPGIFVAGDVAGIEEASSAMIEGRITGAAVANRSGYLDSDALARRHQELKNALANLRKGMFSPANKGRTDLAATEEGYPLSINLLKKGYLLEEDLESFPAARPGKSIQPIIECTQNIPCNPCQDACKCGCITVGSDITKLPVVDFAKQCIDCGMCVASCSGQAIFLINETYEEGYASVTLPYEFLPLPGKFDQGVALDRAGNKVCSAEVIKIRSAEAFDHTNLLTIKVPVKMAMKARFFKCGEEM